MSDITIIHDDCLRVLPTLEAGSVDAVITSPPYNQLGQRMPPRGSGMMCGNGWIAKVAANGYVDDMPEDEYRAWLARVAAALAVAVKPGASFFFNHKIRYRDGAMLHPMDYVREWPGWRLKQEIVWDRCGGIAFNCGLFAPSDERIYWLVRDGAPPTWNDGSASMLSVWRISPSSNASPSRAGHPCPFPMEIPARCIAATTRPGGLVLDPFAGSGTTAEACMKAGRRCIAIEKDARYIPIIERRVAEARTPLFDLEGVA